MPIEIKELIIRTTICSDPKKQDDPQTLCKELMVEMCVDQVLDILNRKKER